MSPSGKKDPQDKQELLTTLRKFAPSVCYLVFFGDRGQFSIESWNWVIWVYVGFGWLQFVVDLQTFFYLSRQLDAIAPWSLAFSWALVSLFEYSLALGDIFFCSDCDYFSFTTLYRNALNNFKWFFSHEIFLRIWGLRSLGKWRICKAELRAVSEKKSSLNECRDETPFYYFFLNRENVRGE